MSDDSISISSDRPAPPKVPSLIRNNIRYSHPNGGFVPQFQQAGGLLEAHDVKTNKLLWTLVVYSNKRDQTLEGDVQDVFFKSMTFQPDGKLHVIDELGREFVVDVDKRTSTPKPSHK